MEKTSMQKAAISEDDLLESIRLEINKSSFDDVQEIRMEKNGRLSVIRKQTN
jgi:uncharacterized membrane protein YcaP (DUF421 family)